MMVILGAPVLPMLLYLTISVCGYLTFGDAVPSNIINAYPGSPLVAACRLVCTYTLTHTHTYLCTGYMHI